MTKVEKLENKIFKLYSQIDEIQRACPHTNASKEGFSDTGNWCKADDCYWWEFRCPDCGKIWTEDQ
jgi:hypothetical protein